MKTPYTKITLLFIAAFSLSITAFSQNQNSLDFDNEDDLVMVPFASAGIAEAPAMSMTAWVFPGNPTPGWPDFDGIVGFRNELDAGFYILHLNATTVELRFRNSQNEVFTFESTGVVLGDWQHMTLTYDGAMLHFYLNGVLSASLPATGNLESANETLWIGSLPFQSNPFHFMGLIDEVSLWNKALSEDEINCIYNNDINPEADNLVVYYKMNQGIAGGNNEGQTDLIDAAGNINGQLEGFALDGFNSNFVEGISNSTDLEETICEGESVEFGGQTFSTAGVYAIALPGTDGCDSIINLTLFIQSHTATVTATDNVLTAVEENVMYQWVDCDDNFTAIAGATGQTFTPTANGNYAVVVIDGDCEEISDCVNVTGVGINDPALLSKLSVFPNPVEDVLFIEFDGTLKMQDLRVYSITGQSIVENSGINANAIPLDMNYLPKGVYSLEIIFENGESVVKRIVKD